MRQTKLELGDNLTEESFVKTIGIEHKKFEKIITNNLNIFGDLIAETFYEDCKTIDISHKGYQGRYMIHVSVDEINLNMFFPPKGYVGKGLFTQNLYNLTNIADKIGCNLITNRGTQGFSLYAQSSIGFQCNENYLEETIGLITDRAQQFKELLNLTLTPNEQEYLSKFITQLKELKNPKLLWQMTSSNNLFGKEIKKNLYECIKGRELSGIFLDLAPNRPLTNGKLLLYNHKVKGHYNLNDRGVTTMMNNAFNSRQVKKIQGIDR